MASLPSALRHGRAPRVPVYLLLVWTWCRASAQYPGSLALLGLAQAFSAAAELTAVLVVFGHAGELAGFTAREAMLVYGLAALAFGTADLLMGSVERIGDHIRAGSLDTLLVRPVSPLLQLAADRFSPHRLGKVVPAAAIAGYALATLDVPWTPGRAAYTPVLLASGVAICCAIWTIGACLQFFITDAREVANSVTYGGQALTEYPLAVYGREIVRAATFTVPLAFVTWQPALYLLDRPDPTGLPDALRFAPPAVAAVLCALAALAWRTGLRRYRSTGS
ncbi:ABC-2 family transporter protein [Nocardiopsis sp. RSe5-2]|uniref:ABC-2 family transporter protein n=1 Tax=Nocardiopsis endophytica TaxID=3018445 RepID=A0ABT4U5I8_9ACTN|nr:ABC-2 family transporter protein [Nocardiopsis endophytica]MDA2812215.1 ABC-2 family transporter protein [Nocardiopsis endophytica]